MSGGIQRNLKFEALASIVAGIEKSLRKIVNTKNRYQGKSEATIRCGSHPPRLRWAGKKLFCPNSKEGCLRVEGEGENGFLRVKGISTEKGGQWGMFFACQRSYKNSVCKSVPQGEK